MEVKSKFRLLQDSFVQDFLKAKHGKIVEFGGTLKQNHREYSITNDYVITNILGDVDEIQDLTHLTYETNSIDHAICISVLQHIFEYDRAINEIIRVLKPGGECLITNGFLFPVCMENDFYRFTPSFWEKRLQNEKVYFEIKLIGNQYGSISNLLMRPYGEYLGLRLLLNKFLSIPFTFLYNMVYKKFDNSPMGVAVIIKKL